MSIPEFPQLSIDPRHTVQAHGFCIRIDQIGSDGDMYIGAEMAEAPEEVGQEGIVIDPVVGRVIKIKGKGNDVYAFLGRHTEHAFSKGENLMTGMGGAFGKEENGLAGPDGTGDLVQGFLPVPGTFTIDKEDPAEPGCKTDQRPGSHFLLGDRHGQHLPHDQQGIEIGPVIADINGRMGGYATFPADIDAQSEQDHMDPQPADSMTPPVAKLWYPAGNQQNRNDQGHQEDQDERPDGGQRNA